MFIIVFDSDCSPQIGGHLQVSRTWHTDSSKDRSYNPQIGVVCELFNVLHVDKINHEYHFCIPLCCYLIEMNQHITNFPRYHTYGFSDKIMQYLLDQLNISAYKCRPSPKTKGLIVYLTLNVMMTNIILKNINPLPLLENLYSVAIKKSHHNNIN
jgi:hypothetical protein